MQIPFDKGGRASIVLLMHGRSEREGRLKTSAIEGGIAVNNATVRICVMQK